MMKDNWKQITPSDYAWEREALAFLRADLPDHEPYRAWANFEFIAQDGSINEVDLLLVTPKACFLVEIKSHPGVIRGDAGTWIWDRPEGGSKAFDNPRLLADRKAKKLASLLRAQPSSRRSKEGIPFISAVVLLSAAGVVNKLEGPARMAVYTRKNVMRQLTEIDAEWSHKTINKPTSKVIARAMQEAGVKESRRLHKVGPYELTDLLDESDHYQEWLARHSELKVARKARVYLVQDKTEEEAQRLRKAAELECQLLEGIEHPGILKAKEFHQHDHGPALIYEHDPDAHRLDLLLRHYENGLEVSQSIYVLRQIAEAVKFAHGQRLYHRALSPHNVFVKQQADGGLICKVGNWSTATRIYDSATQHVSALSHLTYVVREDAGPYVALEAHQGQDGDGVLMDVFSLGAIAYHLFTGQKPAADDLELQDKLGRGQGLQITDVLNGASTELDYLIQYATHPDVTQRIDSVDDFLASLDVVEEALTRPDHTRVLAPTEASGGDVFEGGVKVEKRIGKGASSVVFLVEYQGQQRVLKLAAKPEHNARLKAEAKALDKLRHPAIVAHHHSIEVDDHVGLIIDYAEQGTLAQRLRRDGALEMELLGRFGEDLLSALVHLEDQALFHRDIKPENLGLSKQGSNLHLVLFDFSLTDVQADNITAGTLAYMDPFLRDVGRRRWDDYAERFAASLTLYEMAAGTLPSTTAESGMPLQLDGGYIIDASVFDPSIRERMVGFFEKALARRVAERFANAEDMLRAWRLIFVDAQEPAWRRTQHDDECLCPLEEAERHTQIGLLPLKPPALDALTRRNINTVGDLVGVNRSQVRVWPGVGKETRAELSEVIRILQERFPLDLDAQPPPQDGVVDRASIDSVFAQIMPRANRIQDPQRLQFLNEYLGRLDAEKSVDAWGVHWPSPLSVSGHIGIDVGMVRQLQEKALAQWSKQPAITELRDEIAELLAEQGGVMTALEVAEALLLRRGSLLESPDRERRAQAVTRAAVDVELSKQTPRWVLRRSGRRILLADDRQGAGEELADYAEALGELADDCAGVDSLLSPNRALEKVRAVPAPDAAQAMSNGRLLRLAAAASQQASLSSRAEFYPIGMKAARALELAQGALLGARVGLAVEDVQQRVQGRYPLAEPLPGRPALDELLKALDMDFIWDGEQRRYNLPHTLLTDTPTRSLTHTHFGAGEDAEVVAEQDVQRLEQTLENTLEGGRFLALSVRPRQWRQAKARLVQRYELTVISFDELLLRHLKQHCAHMSRPPDWAVVLKADAASPTSKDWHNLQRLVARVLPAMAEEIHGQERPVLLTDPGLLARYHLISSWLAELRNQIYRGERPPALLLLIAADAQQEGANIDGVTVPGGAGSSEWMRIPSAWLEHGSFASVA